VYVSFWSALWAPKRTPKDIVWKLDAATVESLADPTVRSRLAELGQENSARRFFRAISRPLRQSARMNFRIAPFAIRRVPVWVNRFGPVMNATYGDPQF
jgi:hypothetical protein